MLLSKTILSFGWFLSAFVTAQPSRDTASVVIQLGYYRKTKQWILSYKFLEPKENSELQSL